MTDLPELTRLRFAVSFFGPYHALTGNSVDGLDGGIDEHEPLSRSALKGRMVASARTLGFASNLVERTFGTTREPCRWSWSLARLAGSERKGVLSRTEIDGSTGTVVLDHLQATPVLFPTGGSFEIRLRTRQGLGSDEVPRQALVLAASAVGVTSLGAHRRRGLGWVGIVVDDETRNDLNTYAKALDHHDWIAWFESLLPDPEAAPQ